MDTLESPHRLSRIGTGLAVILFPAVWCFAFAVHPDLLHPRLLLGPEELIWRAHNNGLLQFAHVLVTVNCALLVVLTLHFTRLLDGTRAARAGSVGASLAILGAVMLAAEKGAQCLTMSALDTLPEKQFDAMVPGLVAIFSFKGWMAVTWGLVLMPIGVLIQAAGLWRARVLPAWQAGILLVSLVFIGFPDGAEIVNLTAAIAMAIALIPLGVRLISAPPAAARRPLPRTPAAAGAPPSG